MRSPLVLTLFALAAATAASPTPRATPLLVGGATLPGGPELDALQNSCRACHSFGLVTQQRLDAATWKAEVDKMRKFGARSPPRRKPTSSRTSRPTCVPASRSSRLTPSSPRRLAPTRAPRSDDVVDRLTIAARAGS